MDTRAGDMRAVGVIGRLHGGGIAFDGAAASGGCAISSNLAARSGLKGRCRQMLHYRDGWMPPTALWGKQDRDRRGQPGMRPVSILLALFGQAGGTGGMASRAGARPPLR